MGLDNIVKKLKEEADKEIANLRQAAAAKEKELEVQYEKKFSARREELLSVFKSKLSRETDMELWQIKSRLKSELLSQKKQVVDKIFAGVVTVMKNLSEGDYEKLLSRLLLEIKDKQGEIMPVEGREDLTKKVLQNLKSNLKLSGKSIKAAGGFVLVSEKMNVDYTWESLTQNLREQTELEISKALFN